MASLRYRNTWLGGGFFLIAVVLVFALIPSNRAVTAPFVSDKLIHAFVFFLLMIWFCGLFRFRMAPVIAACLLFYGLLIEYLQSFLPYRSAEWADVIFDFGGILLGWIVAAAGLRSWASAIESWLSRKNILT